ncbi:SH3 domain-containing protein [Aliarcobacter cryaerophilus]|uniref:SH3 domain-containing protein n=1 Tax=Aliarcobacter cryaerophilus TaxID=28198 RepID=A0AA46MZB8_9BACT|nr:SH3 domain-containing protein [Aliarcobacter cryaerophilus]UYF42700.1 SH3 domain-containing protein [Aliarcobacter cryaerophilus]
MSIYPSSVNIDETIQNKVEEQIDLLTKKDKKILEEIFDSIKHQLPDINYLSEKLSKKKYIAILIYILFSIPSILTIYGEYFKKDGISNSYYKINRNNVRIRTEPSTDINSNIIIKLNKNVFVEKIDSYKNWFKVEFEDDNGEEKQGWIRRDMLTKIEIE